MDLPAVPPPISIGQVFVRVSQLPHIPMSRLMALWHDYFEEPPKLQSRVWIESQLAYQIQAVAIAEHDMTLCVTAKLDRVFSTLARRQRSNGRRKSNEKQREVIEETIAISDRCLIELMRTCLTICPELTGEESMWLASRLLSGRQIRHRSPGAPWALRIKAALDT